MYLSKQSIIKAFKTLCSSTPKSVQGFSGLQYFIAIDRYYQYSGGQPCDSSQTSQRSIFSSYVEDVVSLDDNNYLSSFKALYTGSKNIAGTVSSNFFNGSSVELSNNTAGQKFAYPKKGSLLYALDGKVYKEVDYYPNLSDYLEKTNEKIALAVWLLRKKDGFDQLTLNEFRDSLGKIYSKTLVETLLPSIDADQWNSIKMELEVGCDNSVANIKAEDLFSDNVSSDNNIFFEQKIYFGTPGSGKSWTIKQKYEQDEKKVFRTTLHPDTDYATFVGCYKPITQKASHQALIDYNSLVDIFKKYINDLGNITHASAAIGFNYHDSIVKMQEGGVHSIGDLLADAHKSGTTYDTTIRSGMLLFEEQARMGRVNSQITYEFVPQAFTDAYVAAWSDLDNPYYLIIEEINRGNCAQIFGDLFQLLDRNKDGYSEYPIKADHDLRDYLVEHLPEGSEGIKDGKLCLPPNLSIIASMNTSDQSLFPMDSAFKRRWSWEYVPIDYENSESGSFMMTIGGESYNWHDFLKAANKKIKKVTSSEDKQMGNFFIKSSIDEKEFCDKVMFYLWSEVGKDNYQTNDAIFKYYAEEDKLKEFSFNELYDQKKRTTILKGFIRYIEEEEK